MSIADLSTAQKLVTLGRCAVFARIPREAIGVLAEMMATESLTPKETLFETGEPSDRVFVVVDGTLAIFVADHSDPVRTLSSGDLLGEYGMFAAQTRTATARAEGATTLLSLDYEHFRSFLHQFPAAMFALLETAVRRLVEAERKSG